jgi:hypothetical protein
MDPGEQTTGTRDEHYDLVSVLYHALQGADTCNVYALDAEAAGDERLASFFRETSVMQAQLADRAKGMLGIPGPGVTPEPPPGDAAAGISPGDLAGGMPPDETAGGGPRVG